MKRTRKDHIYEIPVKMVIYSRKRKQLSRKDLLTTAQIIAEKIDNLTMCEDILPETQATINIDDKNFTFTHEIDEIELE